MIDVLNLALPYFGLIFLGFACGRYKSIPDRGLAWMDFFIVYLSLPALFFRILATTLGTFLVLLLSLVSLMWRAESLPKPRSRRWRAHTATSATWARGWRSPPSARRRRRRSR